jgi:hypothetical protein
VKRNLDRFPEDFMFKLARKEFEALRLQTAISKRGGRRYLPYAFTEHGVAKISSILSSPRAVQMNILIIRAFIKLREMLATHKDLACKIEELEHQQKEHGRQLASVYSIVKRLIEIPPKPSKPIRFKMGTLTIKLMQTRADRIYYPWFFKMLPVSPRPLYRIRYITFTILDFPSVSLLPYVQN